MFWIQALAGLEFMAGLCDESDLRRRYDFHILHRSNRTLMNNSLSLDELKETGAAPLARVLIVDDEACISDLLSEMLKLIGYATTQCFSPVAAMDLLQKNDFDVILSDYRMPQMNGDEFYQKSVLNRPELATRFIFLTGDTMSDETQQFLQQHSKPHLSKPFDLENVVQVISEVLAQGRPAVAA